MKSQEVGWELRKIISRVAGIAPSELADDHMLREELMLDSLKELEIVAKTEVRFGIELDEAKLVSIRTLKDYCDAVTAAVEAVRTTGDRGSPVQEGV